MEKETKRFNILLAEDDQNLGKLLKEYLEAKDYQLTWAKNGKEALELFKKATFDLCLLDVMMPIRDGFTLAKEIRLLNAQVPIVFLTAKSMKDDAIEGFKAGADDYVTKPFSMEELLLRLTAILRRSAAPATEEPALKEYTIGSYKFNVDQQTLQHGAHHQSLTTKESDLLLLLCKNKNKVLDRNTALKAVWNDDNYFNSRSMDVFLSSLLTAKCCKLKGARDLPPSKGVIDSASDSKPYVAHSRVGSTTIGEVDIIHGR